MLWGRRRVGKTFLLTHFADGKLIVVLDEAPRLLAGRSDFADLLSSGWESRSAGTRLFLALSGSVVSVMEQMLGPQGCLHRRAALERRLDPFSFTDARAFLPGLAAAEYWGCSMSAPGSSEKPGGRPDR